MKNRLFFGHADRPEVTIAVAGASTRSPAGAWTHFLGGGRCVVTNTRKSIPANLFPLSEPALDGGSRNLAGTVLVRKNRTSIRLSGRCPVMYSLWKLSVHKRCYDGAGSARSVNDDRRGERPSVKACGNGRRPCDYTGTSRINRRISARSVFRVSHAVR